MDKSSHTTICPIQPNSLRNVSKKRYLNENRESVTTSQPDHNRFHLLSTVHYPIGVQALPCVALRKWEAL